MKKSILLLVLSSVVLLVSLVAAPYSFASQPRGVRGGGVHGGVNHGGSWGGAYHSGWGGWHGGYHPGFGWRGNYWGSPGWAWGGWGFGGWGWNQGVGSGAYSPLYPNSGYQGTGSVSYPCTLYYPAEYCSAAYPPAAPAVHANRPGNNQTAPESGESEMPASSRNLTEENPSSH